MILGENDPHIVTQEGKAQVGSAETTAVRKRRLSGHTLGRPRRMNEKCAGR